MAVREFDGVDDYIAVSGGSVGALCNGAYSVILLAKPITAVSQSGKAYMGIQVASSNLLGSVADEGGSPSGKIATFTDSEAVSASAGLTADAWQIFGLSKASGTVAPRYHRSLLSGGSWTHANAGGTVANKTNTVTQFEFGAFLGGSFSSSKNCRIAVVAVFPTSLSDANVESIRTAADTQTLLDLGAVALWEFNQASTGDDVIDLTGGFADQVDINGTTVVTTDDPSGWTFGVGGGGGTTHLLAATIAGVSGVSAALTVQKKLAATIAGSSGVAAALTVQKKLAAIIAGQSSVSGALTVQKKLAAIIAGSSDLSGSLTVEKPLAATIAGVSDVQAALSVSGTQLLEASIDGQSSVAADLNVTKPLAATIASESTVAASLTDTKTLAATIAGSSSVTAALRVTKPLAATIASVSTVVARLTVETGVAVATRVYQSLQMIRTRIGW